MIRSFADREAAKVWMGEWSRELPREVQRGGLRKLRMLNQARRIADLRAVPGNRLEALRGSRQGQFSVRINRQWRLCFEWRDGNAYEVEIVDYH